MMNCKHCGGHHESNLCMANNISSMRESVEDVNNDILILSEQNDDSLNTLIEIQDRTNDLISDGLDNLSESIVRGASDISNEVFNLNNSLQQSLKYNIEAQKAIADNISKSLGGINNSILINGILNYIIQDELLEIEEEKLKFEEEESSAGKARRELSIANSLLLVNPEQALIHINKSIDFFPSSSEAFITKGMIESKLGQHELAIISLLCAQTLFDQENYTSSIRHINKQLTRNDIVILNKKIGVALSIEHSLTGESLKSLEALTVLINKYDDDVDLKIEYLRHLGHTYLWPDKYENLIEEIIEMTPTSFDIILTDKQLTNHKEELDKLLDNIKKRKIEVLINKHRVASILKKTTTLLNIEEISKISFTHIIKHIKELDQLLKP
jgi:tetratricopeptide (TPR) repeat protein